LLSARHGAWPSPARLAALPRREESREGETHEGGQQHQSEGPRGGGSEAVEVGEELVQGGTSLTVCLGGRGDCTRISRIPL
jgi:hypothetical protein